MATLSRCRCRCQACLDFEANAPRQIFDPEGQYPAILAAAQAAEGGEPVPANARPARRYTGSDLTPSSIPTTEELREQNLAHNWRLYTDQAQAADVRAEAEDQRDTAIRLFIKNHRRRAARAYAQIILGARFRAMGIQYTPEFDNLFVERGDGTRPEHYACQFQGFLWALGAGDALVVWLPGEEARFFECWNILDLGRAVKQMVPR